LGVGQIEAQFQVINAGTIAQDRHPEEFVDWKNDHEVEFRVILKELNVDRQRFLHINIKDR